MSAVEVLKSSETNSSTSSPIKPGDEAIQPSEAAHEDTGSKKQTVSTWTESVMENYIHIQEHDQQGIMDSPLIFNNTGNILVDVGSEMECVSDIEVPVQNGCTVDPSEASLQTSDLLIDVGLEIGCISNIDVPVEDECTMEPIKCEKNLQTDPCGILSVERFRHSNKEMLHFTGCESYDRFQLILHSLGPAAYCLNYYNDEVTTMSIENQLLLTLVKLRLHWKNFILADMFDVSETTVSNIFITWINYMYYQWKEIEIWPNPELTSSLAHGDSSSKSPKTPILIESIECPIKRPTVPEARQATFSTNKNRHTVKILVGATPSGVISCVSDAYGGSASDQQIAERSDLVTLLDPSESVNADKGPYVQNRVDKTSSSKRAHFKRLIGRAKTYKILREPLSELETHLSTHIIFVCCMLCNFKDSLISKNA